MCHRRQNITSRLQVGTTNSRRFHSSSLSPKQGPQGIVSCLLFHSCGAGVELPALAAGQLCQGSLLLPVAGRDNFLSLLRALLGGLHLISHQTLCLVCGEPQLGQIESSSSCFLGQPPCKYFFPDHQYLECVVAKEER